MGLAAAPISSARWGSGNSNAAKAAAGANTRCPQPADRGRADFEFDQLIRFETQL
jgi:hypothetical protein